jgi:hypothetical protein
MADGDTRDHENHAEQLRGPNRLVEKEPGGQGGEYGDQVVDNGWAGGSDCGDGAIPGVERHQRWEKPDV